MVYVFLANGFEELEAIAPIDILRRAGVDVKTVGIGSNQITAAHEITVKTDTTADKINLSEDVDMIVLPGGMPGADNLENSDIVQSSIDFCVNNNKYVAAICAAPKILGNKGLLNGRNATCFPGFEKYLTGAQLSSNLVVVDDKFVTSKGAGACIKFGLKLVELLVDKEKSDELEAAMQCI